MKVLILAFQKVINQLDLTYLNKKKCLLLVIIKCVTKNFKKKFKISRLHSHKKSINYLNN